MERSLSTKEVLDVFKTRCSPTSFGYCDKWIHDTNIVGYMSTWLPGLSTTRLHLVLSKDVVLKLCFEAETSEPNKFGWYRHKVTIQKKRYTFFYVSSDTTTRPVIFDDHQEWLEAAETNTIRRSGRAKPTKRRNEESPGLREGTLNTSKQARNTSTPPAIKSTATQQHGQPPQIGDSPTEMQTSPPHDNTNQVLVGAIQHPELATDEIGHDHPQSLLIGFSVFESEMIQGLLQQMESAYFDEPRNRRLFAGKCDSPGSSKRNLERWIETLERAISNVEALPNVVNKGDIFPLNQEQQQRVLLKATYLQLSYKIALLDMPHGRTWLNCISEAISKMEQIYGEKVKKHPKTIARFHRYFRENDSFPHPNYHVHIGKEPSPVLFVHIPEAKVKFECWAKENLSTLTTESALMYLRTTLLPDMHTMIVQECMDTNATPVSYEAFLASMKLSTILQSTAWRCIAAAGFVFKEHTKTYFTDRHENAENVAHRAAFVKKYFKWEELSYRWVQLPTEDAIKLENEGNAGKEKLLPNSFVFEYTDVTTGKQMREYHVDAFPSEFERYIKPENTIHNGNLSHRFPSDRKPVILIGQDESIYKQFSFSSKAWYTKDGATKMLPKDDGHGMMISTFVSRSWGFLMNGNPLLAASLFRINELRLHATHIKYVSTEAAVNLNGHTAKTPITNAQPFTRFFEYGADKEGYWNYEYMALQLEDIVDCLVVMFPAHDFVFLFDQSSGHGKQQSDGLNALNMNNDWGGAVPSMRDTQIIDQACLGPYNHDDKLRVGDVQHLVYQENDRGPAAKKGHRLNDAQRVASKNTHRTGRKKKRNLTKKELMAKLVRVMGPGMQRSFQSKNAGELQDLCKRSNIATVIEDDVIEEGWMNAAKGLFQVLWERGWIDPNNMIKYVKTTRDAWLEADKKTVKEAYQADYKKYSMVHLMSECSDFKNEKSAMEKLAEDLSERHRCRIEILVSTKYHCEMAGEGIEYGWGYSKKVFRAFSLNEKKDKAAFLRCLTASLKKTTPEIMRKMYVSKGTSLYARVLVIRSKFQQQRLCSCGPLVCRN